jgi:hypothetical protein
MALPTNHPTRQEAPVPGRRRHPGRLWWVVGSAVVVLAVLVTAVASAARSNNNLPAVRVFTPPHAAPPPATPIQPVGYWVQKYQENWDDIFRMALPLSKSADSWNHYEVSYEVDADTAMFRATDDTKYLDRALTYIDNVVATARPSSSLSGSQYHDKYLGWVSAQENNTEVPLYESYFWRYATTTLRVMRQTAAVYNDPKYRAEYERLLNFAEVDIFEKWYARGTDNVYRSETHLVSHWALIAVNLSAITTDAKRRAQYRTVVANIDNHLPNAPSSLRQQLIRSPADSSAYFWSADWGSFRRPGQDVSHGNGVIAYVVEAADQNVDWTATDMNRFLEVLTHVISPRDGGFPAYVDGTGSDNGWISDGFVKLARYRAAAKHQLES